MMGEKTNIQNTGNNQGVMSKVINLAYSGGGVSCLSALFRHANGDDCSYRAYALEKCGRPTWYKRHCC